MLLKDPELQRLRRLLGRSHGVDLSYYTASFLNRRVAARMRKIQCHEPSQYLAKLEGDEAELTALVAALTVNVTGFFRDAAVYDALRKGVLPILTLSGPRRISAWSAGCATGEEPYTLAMMLDEALSPRPGFSYLVHASDINPRQLQKARAATYPARGTADVANRYLKRYFVPAGQDLVSISPTLRANTRFHQYDLSCGQPPPLGPVDLIFCRNVMIYFSTAAKERLLGLFQRALAPGGFLVLGGSEVILPDRLFCPFDVKSKIYRVAPRPGSGQR